MLEIDVEEYACEKDPPEQRRDNIVVTFAHCLYDMFEQITTSALTRVLS